MLISAAQIDIRLADVAGNLERAANWIERAGQEGSQFVVLPECALSGYCFDSRQQALRCGLSIDDPRWTLLMEVARQYTIYAVVGFLELDADGHLFNASALLGPGGVVGVYRKVHLPHLGVDRFVDPGDRPYRIHMAGDARVGLAICYDSSFPEPMRVLGLAGADIIALATNWPVAAQRTADIVPPARSMENHLFFVAANRVGRECGFTFCGRSSICGPDGVELARSTDDREQLLHADVDVTQARNKRIERTVGAHVIDRFADRRPQFYGPILDDVRR